MAPEEFARGALIDQRTTAYVFGRTLYHLFDSPSAGEGLAADDASRRNGPQARC